MPGLFDGVAQTQLVLAGHPTRLPVFIRDAGAFAAVFPARLSALRDLLPDRIWFRPRWFVGWHPAGVDLQSVGDAHTPTARILQGEPPRDRGTPSRGTRGRRSGLSA